MPGEPAFAVKEGNTRPHEYKVKGETEPVISPVAEISLRKISEGWHRESSCIQSSSREGHPRTESRLVCHEYSSVRCNYCSCSWRAVVAVILVAEEKKGAELKSISIRTRLFQ